MSAARIAPVTAADLPRALPLIAEYQRFYGAEPDGARNEAFFSRFVGAGDEGLLLGAWAGDALAGFACAYWTLSSVEAVEVALLNDLFVADGSRGAGIGGALIDAVAAAARERGLTRVRWMTALDNRRAQRLYERTGADRTAWFEYELRL